MEDERYSCLRLLFAMLFKKVLVSFKLFFVRLFASRKGGQIHYVNGSDTLPPPLDAETESRMLGNIDDPESRNALIEHNLRLVVYIAKRFENTGAGIEELVSIGTVGLIKAISTYNTEKNIKLATYASRCIENEILMFIRKNSATRREVSFDEPLSVDWDGNELLLSDVLGSDADLVSREMEEDEERRLVLEAVENLSPRERLIIEMRYGLGGRHELTQKEVADALGISQSYISRLEKKIMQVLKRKIEEKI